MDRYQKTLAESQVIENDEVVAAEVKKIVENSGKYATPEAVSYTHLRAHET